MLNLFCAFLNLASRFCSSTNHLGKLSSITLGFTYHYNSIYVPRLIFFMKPNGWLVDGWMALGNHFYVKKAYFKITAAAERSFYRLMASCTTTPAAACFNLEFSCS